MSAISLEGASRQVRGARLVVSLFAVAVVASLRFGGVNTREFFPFLSVICRGNPSCRERFLLFFRCSLDSHSRRSHHDG